MSTYYIKVFSITNGVRAIEAESAEEAFRIVDEKMKESIARMIRKAEVREDIFQITGRAGAEGTPIKPTV